MRQVRSMGDVRTGKAAIQLVLFLLLSAGRVLASPQSLDTRTLSLFPKNAGELSYVDLSEARKSRWFLGLAGKLIPPWYESFREFLQPAGLQDGQVKQIAWALVPQLPEPGGAKPKSGLQPEDLIGIATGEFSVDSAAAYFDTHKVPTVKVEGNTLYAFGTGSGPNDLFVVFLDSNTCAFGNGGALETMLRTRGGSEESFVSNDVLFPLVRRLNGGSLAWSVFGPQYAAIAFEQLTPALNDLPGTDRLVKELTGMTLSIQADQDLDLRVSLITKTPEVANLFAALLRAGCAYGQLEWSEKNKELADALGNALILPSGPQVNLQLSVTQEALVAMIQAHFLPTAN